MQKSNPVHENKHVRSNHDQVIFLREKEQTTWHSNSSHHGAVFLRTGEAISLVLRHAIGFYMEANWEWSKGVVLLLLTIFPRPSRHKIHTPLDSSWSLRCAATFASTTQSNCVVPAAFNWFITLSWTPFPAQLQVRKLLPWIRWLPSVKCSLPPGFKAHRSGHLPQEGELSVIVQPQSSASAHSFMFWWFWIFRLDCSYVPNTENCTCWRCWQRIEEIEENMPLHAFQLSGGKIATNQAKTIVERTVYIITNNSVGFSGFAVRPFPLTRGRIRQKKSMSNRVDSPELCQIQHPKVQELTNPR